MASAKRVSGRRSAVSSDRLTTAGARHLGDHPIGRVAARLYSAISLAHRMHPGAAHVPEVIERAAPTRPRL